MSQNDDHIRGEGEDDSRTLDAGKLLYELSSTIGNYKLLRILGEGGFGIVYLAEQQRPMKRQVALKIIKAGMDSTGPFTESQDIRFQLPPSPNTATGDK